jgi:glucokinase
VSRHLGLDLGGSSIKAVALERDGASWDGVPVREPVRQALGLPTRLINDARAFGFAEWRLGAARACDTAAFYTLGTGVGVAIANTTIVLTPSEAGSPRRAT